MKTTIEAILNVEKCDGLYRLLVPRHEDVQKTVFLDTRNLVINTSGIGKDRDYPSIKEMVERLWPTEENK